METSFDCRRRMLNRIGGVEARKNGGGGLLDRTPVLTDSAAYPQNWF